MPGQWKTVTIEGAEHACYTETTSKKKCFAGFHPEMSSNEIALGLTYVLEKTNAVEFIDDKVKARLIKLLSE